jgi:dTDP-4-amino-4,6-dideoxygalactose transaminase
MYEAVSACKLSGNGAFTKRCQAWFEQRYGFLASALLENLCEIYNATKGERYV